MSGVHKIDRARGRRCQKVSSAPDSQCPISNQGNGGAVAETEKAAAARRRRRILQKRDS